MNICNPQKFTPLESLWSKWLPVAFLFMQYFGIAKLTIGMSICFFYSVICLLRYGKGNVFSPLIIYTAYFFFYTIYITLISRLSITPWFYVIFYRYSISIFIVTIISQHLDRTLLYKTWKLLAIIVCLAVIYQAFQIYVLHETVSTISLFPKLSEGQPDEAWEQEGSRPVAFFTEPSAIVAFLLPVLFLALGRKEMLFSFFLTLCILLTTSTSGIIVSLILWGVYYADAPIAQRRRYFFFILFVVLLFFLLPVFQTALDKLNLELSGESSNAFSRVYSGWLLYAHLDLKSQIFGIPDYDYSNFIRQNAAIFADFVSQTRMDNEEVSFFFNTAQHIFLRSGLVGGILYVYMLFKLFKATDKEVRPFFYCVIAMMFFELNFFFHNFFVIQYILLLSYSKQYKRY